MRRQVSWARSLPSSVSSRRLSASRDHFEALPPHSRGIHVAFTWQDYLKATRAADRDGIVGERARYLKCTKPTCAVVFRWCFADEEPKSSSHCSFCFQHHMLSCEELVSSWYVQSPLLSGLHQTGSMLASLKIDAKLGCTKLAPGWIACKLLQCGHR